MWWDKETGSEHEKAQSLSREYIFNPLGHVTTGCKKAPPRHQGEVGAQGGRGWVLVDQLGADDTSTGGR